MSKITDFPASLIGRFVGVFTSLFGVSMSLLAVTLERGETGRRLGGLSGSNEVFSCVLLGG